MTKAQHHSAPRGADAGAKRFGRAGIVSAALFLAAAATASAATDPRYEGTPEQQEACTPDAMNICQAFIPDAGRIKECLVQHVKELSPACREVFEPHQSNRRGG